MINKTILFVAVLVFFGASTFNSVVLADSRSADWFNSTKELELTLEEENVTPPASTYWGIPCEQVKGYAMTYSYWGIPESKAASNVCAQSAGYGYFSDGNKLTLAGTNTSYRLLWNTDTTAVQGFLSPVPNTGSVIHFNDKMSVYNNFTDMINPVYSNQVGRIGQLDSYRIIPSQADYAVRYFDGTELNQIKANGFSFARRGGKVVVNIGSHQALIDTNTKQAKRFGKNSIASGSVSTMKTSLNSDGTAAITVNSNPSSYSMYDLANCTEVQVGKAEICPERNYGAAIRAHLGAYVSILYARFVTDTTLEVYVKNTVDGISETNRYTLRPQGAQEDPLQYLALGDSFASGEGAYDYKPTTDTVTNTCHTSTSSYPYLISSTLEYSISESIACSGAKIKDIFREGTKDYRDESPQAKHKDESAYDAEIFDNFLPGYRRQIDFVEKNQPTLITLSIGGNDIDFGKKLRKCIITPYDCFGSESDRYGILKEIKAQFSRLEKTYTELKSASPKTRIYVLGYPELALPGGNCANNVRLSSEELELARDIVTDLNNTIELAAKKAGAFYVDVSKAMEGHRLCEDESWSLAINGITAGNDMFVAGLGPLGSETYHPNKLGHVLYKRAILQKTNNLTVPMPDPDSMIDINNLQSRLVPDIGVVTSTVPLPILHDGISGEIMRPGEVFSQNISIAGHFLKPGSTYQFELRSEPVTIGTVDSTGLQELSLKGVIPVDTEPGLHSLHITGVNIDNEPIDIYKNIIVAANEEDHGGDEEAGGGTDDADHCEHVNPGTDEDGCSDETNVTPEVPPAFEDQPPGVSQDNVQVKGPLETVDKSSSSETLRSAETLLGGDGPFPRSLNSGWIGAGESLSNPMFEVPRTQFNVLTPQILGAADQRLTAGRPWFRGLQNKALLIGVLSGLTVIAVMWGFRKRKTL